MLFNSLTFLIFFATTYLLFWLLRDWGARKNLLLISSYLFYAAWNPPYVFLLLLSSSFDWCLAGRLGRSTNPNHRRAMLVASLISNLGLLGYFKYGGFLLANFGAVLTTLGVHYQPPESDIVLPVGISFYTFASLSYTIDVYRREIEADWSFCDYALFVSFFPHLVAGPIVRAGRLLPQIREPRSPTADQIGWGLTLVCIGLFGKVVMADYVFAPLVDQVYSDPAHFSSVDTWAAVLSFSGQIYYDFSGYSLCAIGLALCFGFAFPDNFRHPYAARGFSDFWQRWHISLSTWLRDYLYIPMGGSRGSAGTTYRNLMLTMLIGGLWHGASWMFVLWGGLHGLYLAVERGIQGKSRDSITQSRLGDLALTLFTFLIVTLTWIPFRTENPYAAAEIVKGLFRLEAPIAIGAPKLLLAVGAIAATICWHLKARDSSLEAEFVQIGGFAQTLLIAACLISLFLCSGGDQRAFIYFQF